MTSILKSIFPVSSSSSKKDDHDEFDVEYSIAVEYSGPPVSCEIPQVVPVDLHRIPTATMVAAASISNSRNLSLPVIQPIVKSANNKGKSKVSEFANELAPVAKTSLGDDNRKASLDSDGVESSGTLGFSDIQDDSNEISGSSDVEDSCDDCKVDVGFNGNIDLEGSRISSPGPCAEVLSIQEEEEYINGSTCQESTLRVTFNEIHSSDNTASDSDDEEQGIFPEKSVVVSDSKKCFRCHERGMFLKKEVCLVCHAKYCNKCVLRAMGAMPEGRKCITCIGYRISETKRDSLGKCSGMLKILFTDQEIERIMKSERSCKANQLPSNLVLVNGKYLSHKELVLLQSCPHPPKKLKPGRFWYDKVSGYWGKEGHKPCQIISPELEIGGRIQRNASNGNTDVLINSREITRSELLMLQLIGIRCEKSIHIWLDADGSCRHEGMNNVMGKLWEKTGSSLVCAAFSLPTPPKSSSSHSQKIDGQADVSSQDQGTLTKLLLVGCDQSGTSTIFKQAKIQYKVPFREDERENFKSMIQSNLYSYISILLEGRERFEEECRVELRRKRIEEPGPSVIPDDVEDENVYSISPRLKKFADWLLEIQMAGNLEVIFPAANREYAPYIEELWKDKAFLATFHRRNELEMLPRVANYFLDRAVEISKADYEPSDMDILYAEGSSTANGVASIEFSLSLNKLSLESYMETFDQNSFPIRCQLIRAHASSLGGNCKFLEMFEDANVVLYTVSLTNYHEYFVDSNGDIKNKMLESRALFESIVNHPCFAEKHFLLLLNKFDLLEELLEQFPLTECEWLEDFNPVISLHPNSSSSNNNPSLAQRAFHFIASRFKALFRAMTGRKLYVKLVTGLDGPEGETVDEALKYAGEIVRWEDEKSKVLRDWTTESMEETSTSV